jgi:hypothetical protein
VVVGPGDHDDPSVVERLPRGTEIVRERPPYLEIQ